jgi:Zn-dependent protease with chaperone function
MPALEGKLPDDEIRAVLAHIKSHWTSADILSARAEMLRDAAQR